MTGREIFGIDVYVDIVYRHRVIALCALVVGLILTAIASVMLPRSYESSSIVAVSPSRVSSQYVPSSSSSADFKSRIERLQQEVLSTTSLERVIQTDQLYLRRRTRGESIHGISEYMRTHIKVVVTTEEEWNKGPWGSVKLSFAHSTPIIAQQVTRSLANLFVEQDWIEQKEAGRAAAQFLGDQLQSSEGKLDAKTREIKAFKDEFQGSLPEDLDVNLKTLASLQSELGETTGSLTRLEERRMQLERNLAGAREQGVSIPSSSGQTTWRSPQAALRAMETQLAVLRAQYKDEHPDVVQLEAEIAAVKKKFEQSGQKIDSSSDNQSPLDQELRKERDTISDESARVHTQISRLHSQIADYQERVRLSPVNEQRLANLTRDYTVLTNQYHALLEKKLAAQMYENLVERGDGERLRVTEPASFPDAGFPQTSVVAAVGGILSVVLALALPFVMFTTDTSLKDVDDFVGYELEVSAAIPTVPAFRDSGRQFSLMAQALGASSVCVILGAAALWACSSLMF